MLAFWMGGAAAGQRVDPPAPPPPSPSLGGGGKRGDSDRWRGWPKETATEKPALSTLEIEAKRRRRDEDDMMLTIIIQAVTKGLL